MTQEINTLEEGPTPSTTSEKPPAEAGLISSLDLAKDFLWPFRRGPPKLLWEITYDCNLSCIYCYNSCPKRQTGALSPWQRRKVARKLINSRLLNDGICFSGGEPTLAPDFMDLARIFHEEGHHSGMITNGVGIVPERISKILDYFNRIKISLDTLDPEEAAQINGDPKAPEIAVSALTLLEREGFDMRSVAIAMVRPWFNAERISEVLELAGGLGVHQVQGGPPDPLGRAWDGRYSSPQPGIEALVKQFSNKYPKTDFCLSCAPTTTKNEEHVLLGELVDSFWITPRGGIKAAFLPFNIGNILQDDLAQLWGSYYSKRVYSSLLEEFRRAPLTKKERQQLSYRYFKLPRVEMERVPFYSPAPDISPAMGPGYFYIAAPGGYVLSFLESLFLQLTPGRSFPELAHVLRLCGFEDEEIREAARSLMKKKAVTRKMHTVPAHDAILKDVQERGEAIVNREEPQEQEHGRREPC